MPRDGREHRAQLREYRLRALVAAKRLRDRVRAVDDLRRVRRCRMPLGDVVVLGRDVRLLKLADLELQ